MSNLNLKELSNEYETNFHKIIEFNKVFGVKTFDTYQPNIFNKDPNLTKLRLELIKEEVSELEDAIKNKDFPEVVDALADILYVVYGAGASFGVNLNEALDMVHKSNMSKLCDNVNEAKETVIWYNEQYESGKLPYDSVTYRPHGIENKWIVYKTK